MSRNKTTTFPSFVRGLAIGAALLAWAPQSARADFKTMSQRLPPETDAVIAINIAKVLETPYAKQHKWGENVADAWARKPVMIPPGSTRLLMAAGIKPSVMESGWEISMVEMTAVPSLDELVAGEGGHIDRIWDRNAVVSPVNAYFVPLENNVLATVTPAERQAVTRWVRMPVKPEGSLNSAYLREIAATLNDDTHIMLAIDLEGAISPPKVQKALTESDIKELAGKDHGAIAKAMGTLRGVSLTVRVGEQLLARAAMDFTGDVKVLQSVAKPITLEVLDRVGFALPDAGAWTFTVEGKQVIAQGNLSDSGARLLMGLIQSPIPAATVKSGASASASPGAAAPAKAAPLDAAQASVRYYKAVSGVVDSFGPSTSVSAAGASMRQGAKRIDQLPILNVDPMLIEWGALVSFKIKQATGISGVTQSNMSSRVAGERSAEYGTYTYDNYGDYRSGTWVQADREAANQRARSAAMEQKAQGQKQVTGLIEELGTARAQVRAKMVAKYGIEF